MWLLLLVLLLLVLFGGGWGYRSGWHESNPMPFFGVISIVLVIVLVFVVLYGRPF